MNILTCIFFSSLLLFSPFLSFARVGLLDPPLTEWSRAYAGNGWDASMHARIDWICSLVQTIDGGYALAGHTTSFGRGAWLIKTDAEGYPVWNKTYGEAGFDEATSLVQTGDGGYAMAGAGESILVNSSEWQNTVCLVKTDANDTLLWNWTYVDVGSGFANSMVQTSDGGYALAGKVYPGAGNGDFWLVKTDASGALLWSRTYGGTEFEEAYSVVQTVDGGYALAGSTKYSDSVYREDFWLVKTDADGNMLWNRTYGGTGSNRAYSVVQTTDGGYALAGSSDDFSLMKTDANGNLLWNRTLQGDALSMVQTNDCGFALAGLHALGSTSDFWLAKTDENGKLLWVNDDRSLFGFGMAYSAIQTSDGGYAMAGVTMRSNDQGELVDGWLVKLGANPRLVGDFTGRDDLPDGRVDMRDIGLIAVHFGETVPPADPSWDIYQNGEIDHQDISIVASHFGDHYP
jgi:hypothetical protein